MEKKVNLIFLLIATMVLGSCASNRKVTVSPPTSKVPHPQTLPIQSLNIPVQAFQTRQADKVSASDSLISRVDAIYSQGMQEYQSGQLQDAKDKFDKALGLLLESNLDIQGNDRLNAEFEKVVEGTYGLEVATLENGDTLSQHEYEPAPIESFAGLTFPVDPKVRQQVQHELLSVRSDLPLISNDYVAGFLSFFQNRGQGFIQTILKRIGLYQPMISQSLREQGLPQDLIYLAAAESAFTPTAVSRAGARGIWQLMPSRAEEYGLKLNRWEDQREDPKLSTEAAVQHLKDLYKQFGDWYLALAAYNCGPLNVQKAIERTGYASFWKLRELQALPVETQNYVPIIIATALIAKDPHTYGFDIKPDPPIHPDQVIVTAPIDLRLVADLIDRPVEDVTRLNPSLRTWVTPLDSEQYVLNLPAGTKDQYESDIDSIPSAERRWWRVYRVEGGETLSDIARKYRISKSVLARANHLESVADVEAGTHLIVPLPEGRQSLYRHGQGPERLAVYRIRRGDTLSEIAARFHVTVAELRQWNHLRSSRVAAGRTLQLYARSENARYTGGSGKRSIYYYQIKPGDTLSSIASRFRVTVAELRSWNHLDGSTIVAGTRLKLYRARRATAQVASGEGGPSHSSETYHYRIRQGDTLIEIADHFDVSISQLRQWNHLSNSRIVAGEVLTLYGVSED